MDLLTTSRAELPLRQDSPIASLHTDLLGLIIDYLHLQLEEIHWRSRYYNTLRGGQSMVIRALWAIEQLHE